MKNLFFLTGLLLCALSLHAQDKTLTVYAQRSGFEPWRSVDPILTVTIYDRHLTVRHEDGASEIYTKTGNGLITETTTVWECSDFIGRGVMITFGSYRINGPLEYVRIAYPDHVIIYRGYP